MHLLFILTFCVFYTNAIPDSWHYRVLFNRFNTTVCHYQSYEQMIEPWRWSNGIKIREGNCFEWKDKLPFVGFSYTWLAHVDLDTEHIGDYGRCEIAVYGRDNCAGEAVGWVDNSNTRNQSSGLCYAMEGREGKSVKVSCDRKRKPDWDSEAPLAPGFNWNQCKKGPCHPPAP